MTGKRRKLKLIIILSVFLFLVLIGTNVAMSYYFTKKTVEVTTANNALQMAKEIVGEFDTQSYERFLKEPVRNDDYWKIRNFLNDIREKTGALYVYTLSVKPSKAEVLIAGFPDDGHHYYDIGLKCTIPQKQLNLANNGKSYFTGVIDGENYGKYLSVGVPIKNKENTIIGYLAIDISLESLKMIGNTVINNQIMVFIFNGLFVIFLLVAFYVMQRWYQKELKTEVGATEKIYQTELDSLYHSARSIRHDFANHIQILHGLLKLKKSEEALDYLDSLRQEIQNINTIPIETKNPALLVLFQTKTIQAQNNKVDIDFDVCKDDFESIKAIDLIKIISNLIDNAIDATIQLPEHERRIEVICNIENNHYVFKIKNTGPTISDTEKIFEAGFTSKKPNEEKVQGQGLYIVKQVIEKYKGKIDVESKDGLTQFKIFIPINKRGVNRES